MLAERGSPWRPASGSAGIGRAAAAFATCAAGARSREAGRKERCPAQGRCVRPAAGAAPEGRRGQLSTVVAEPDGATEGLEPKLLWQRFSELSRIPRPSHHERAVCEWIKGIAEARSLEWRQDEAGNLVVYRPGSGGGEGAPAVCIQGHVDMVTEKAAGSEHDFLRDPIKLVRKGGWLAADGTTLGSDNGIGVCAALALLEAPGSEKLPPLECLFTVAEEVGLVGAFNLDASLVTARTMLNLDTEEWPRVYFGCAGGGNSVITVPVQRAPAPQGCEAVLDITASGLKGGHSGLNIGEDRGNAVLCCARVTQAALAAAGPSARLLALSGGDKHNAIPREANAPAAERAAAAEAAVLQEEYGLLEDKFVVAVVPSSAASERPQPLAEDSAGRLLSLLSLLPHGALKTSHAVPGLVETSNNVASVQCGASEVTVVCSSRSSIGGALEAVRRRIKSLCGLVGAACEQQPSYPGWAPDPSSEVLGLVREEAAAMGLARSPAEVEVHAIHAGLECGVLKAKCPGMDAVSFGPTITGAHSPEERVELATVPPFWELTLRVLRRLAERRA